MTKNTQPVIRFISLTLGSLLWFIDLNKDVIFEHAIEITDKNTYIFSFLKSRSWSIIIAKYLHSCGLLIDLITCKFKCYELTKLQDLSPCQKNRYMILFYTSFDAKFERRVSILKVKNNMYLISLCICWFLCTHVP